MIKKMYIGLHVKYRYRQILKKLGFSQQSFKTYINTEFHETLSSGSRDVPCRRTARHDEANSRFSQFCERLKMYEHKNSERVYAKRQNAKLRRKYCKTNIYEWYKNMKHERHKFSEQLSIRLRKGKACKDLTHDLQ
jgi:hypothetical protein